MPMTRTNRIRTKHLLRFLSMLDMILDSYLAFLTISVVALPKTQILQRELYAIVWREYVILLTGSKLSLGTLRSIVHDVEEGGLDRMPGYCVSDVFYKKSVLYLAWTLSSHPRYTSYLIQCMDVATNSEYFGYDVREPCCSIFVFISTLAATS